MEKILRHPPKFTYSGLTIIMSNRSRFDKTELLSGVAGVFFNEECLYPHVNRYQCDIRLIEDKSPLLPNTKCILLLGQRAQSIYTGATTSLDENRGSPFMVDGIPCISSFTPQDCMDQQNFEKRFNAEALAGTSAENEDEEFHSDETDAGEVYESKGRGRTARSNYRFWLKQDLKKVARILENNGKVPLLYETTPEYHIYPSAATIIEKLSNTEGQDLFFDMETDFMSMDMRCFALSFSGDPFNIFVVPVLDTNYKPAYEKLPEIFAALRIAIARNTLVAHNGQVFDFNVLAFKYGIPVGKCYDTMIAAKRIFPTVEKSLGHWVSLCTFEPYHKNEGVHAYQNNFQAEQLYKYCGKDVFTMYLVKKWQDEKASKDEGLKRSIDAAMRAIKPYMTMVLTGMKYDEALRKKWIDDNDFLMTFYMRCLAYLVGPSVAPLISNKTCVKYFHEQMEYPVVMRSKKTNKPSLAADALYKLKLKDSENPVIDLLIKFREKQKETGTLKFKPYMFEEDTSCKSLQPSPSIS